MVSTTLVLFMTPGLALYYGGMVRTKSASVSEPEARITEMSPTGV